jgi:hypothetical protein
LSESVNVCQTGVHLAGHVPFGDNGAAHSIAFVGSTTGSDWNRCMNASSEEAKFGARILSRDLRHVPCITASFSSVRIPARHTSPPCRQLIDRRTVRELLISRSGENRAPGLGGWSLLRRRLRDCPTRSGGRAGVANACPRQGLAGAPVSHLAPSPLPAHRTGQAICPHPSLGEGVTDSLSERRAAAPWLPGGPTPARHTGTPGSCFQRLRLQLLAHLLTT